MFRKSAVDLLPLFLFFAFLSSSFAQSRQDRPKIVVGVVVDQMRWDYLYRYQDRYQEGGFKRMLRNGFSCENTHINYGLTATGPGHTCVYTGSVPSVHGIIGNTWYDRTIEKEVNCVEDSTVVNVGIPGDGKSRSPRNLLTTTIGDELKLSNNFRSKVVGVSLKDRGAILPGGHLSDGSYWYHGGSGRFITSTFYRDELPQWVRDFNDRKLPEQFLREPWQTLYPLETYRQSTEDDKPYEKTVAGKEGPVFPFEFDASGYGGVRNTPYGNSLVFEMGKAAIEGESLGSGDFTDMLALSFSATDGLGHGVGPNAVEIEDMYLRLDQDFADFFQYLDDRFGEDGYLFFITADHGAAHSAGFLMENQLPGGVYDLRFILEINHLIKDKYGISQVIESAQNAELYLNWKEIRAAEGLDEGALMDEIVHFIIQQEGIANAWPTRKLVGAPWPELVKSRYINGYNAQRGGDIVIIPQTGWQASEKGTNHGLWYPFDAHIPLVWMGWNIPHGHTNRFVGMTDIAPTLAALLKIQMPSGSVGQPIFELTDR